MKKLVAGIICLAVISLFIAGATGVRAEASLKAGAGRVDVTPKPGCFLGGYFFLTDPSKGVHDPLNARALVLDDGKTKIALVTIDLVVMAGSLASLIKERVAAEFGIPPENINVSATHTHTGPEEFLQEFGRYPKKFLPEMKELLASGAVEAVRKAVTGMAPATFGYEQFKLEGFSHNRHDPKGAVDPTAIVGMLRDSQGKIIGGFLNFAAHPTVVPAGDLLISGEWTGQFQTLMEEKTGAGAFLYLQGASGNISPALKDVGDGWAQAADLAKRVQEAVLPHAEAVKTSGDITLAAARKDFEFKIRSRKSVTDFYNNIPAREAQIKASALPDDEKEREIGWLREKYGIENFMQMLFPTMSRIKGGKTKSCVEAMRIGSLLLTAFPGEAVAELGVDIRSELAPSSVAVLGYSNDHLGYITTQKIYDQGGYEAGMGLVYPEATEQMRAELVSLARTLRGN